MVGPGGVEMGHLDRVPVIAASSLALHPRPPEEVLSWAAEAGFSGVEILCEPPWHPGGWGRERRRRVRKLSQSLSLSLHAPIADLNLMSPHPRVRELAATELSQTICLAEEVGASHVTFHLGYRPGVGLPGEPPWEAAREALKAVLSQARARGVTLCLENDPPFPGAYLAQLPRWQAFLEEVGLSGTLDLGHAWLAQGKESLKGIPPQVEVVHLHDNRGGGDEHLAPGEGEIPWGQLLPRLNRVRVWVLEVKDIQGLASSRWWLAELRRGI